MANPFPRVTATSRRALRAAAGSATPEASTPLWDALMKRPPRPSAPAGPQVFADTATPIWDAVTRDTAVSRALASQPSQAAAAASALASQPSEAAPAIFRAPPPATPRTAIPRTATPRWKPRMPARATISAPPRHARRSSAVTIRTALVALTAAVLVLGGSAAVTAATAGTGVTTFARTVVEMSVVAAGEPTASVPADAAPAPAVSPSAPPPPLVIATPTAMPEVAAQPAALEACADPDLAAALQDSDEAAVIAAIGGADAFRAAVAGGTAPCIDLGDPTRAWVVVDKARPLGPIDFAPAPLAMPEGVRSIEGGELRADAATAMSTMVSAAAAAGVGEIALESAYRSYTTQQTSFGNQVQSRGEQDAEMVSARPGYSEHQTGLAADVVACTDTCGSFDDLAATAQGQWIAEHAWEFGWIVRYEDGHAAVTGYSPEPWHLRYVGTDLAAAYHDGGWHTLEEFFGLPAAPDYGD